MKRAECINCGSRALYRFLDFGLQPNGNNFLEPDEVASEPLRPSKELPTGLTPSQKGNITWWRNQLVKATAAGYEKAQAKWTKKLEDAGVL